jgi:predicted CXXCH cytochrome family protein
VTRLVHDIQRLFTHQARGLAVPLAVALTSCADSREAAAPPTVAAAPQPAPHPTGDDCARCHPDQTAPWSRSHHALAHDAPSTAVYDGTPVAAGTLRVRPMTVEHGDALEVRDAAGTHLWPVRRTIGVAPLQQVLLDAGDGRLVVGPIAWDVMNERWYDPSVDGASGDPADRMYWAGILGTWNHMCVDCHATDVRKGWREPGYATVEGQPNVGCVACHDGGTSPGTLAEQIDRCGPCHTRGERIAHRPPGGDLLDHVVPVGLLAPILLDDGAPGADEPFEVLSYLTGAMGRAGVPCTACHDPHSGGFKAEGDAVCTGCHPASHDDRAHPGDAVVSCVQCHAPTRTYMGTHARHDHRFPAPGPDDTRACAACHDDPAASWAASPWSDLPPDPRRAALRAARSGDPTALAALPVTDGPWRAAAVTAGAVQGPALHAALRADDPWVRLAAVRSPALADPRQLVPAFSDPTLAVRLAAVERWVSAGGSRDPAIPGLNAAADAWEASLRADGDLATSHHNLAVLRLWSGDLPGGLAAARTAVALDPTAEDSRLLLEAVERLEARP